MSDSDLTFLWQQEPVCKVEWWSQVHSSYDQTVITWTKIVFRSYLTTLTFLWSIILFFFLLPLFLLQLFGSSVFSKLSIAKSEYYNCQANGYFIFLKQYFFFRETEDSFGVINVFYLSNPNHLWLEMGKNDKIIRTHFGQNNYNNPQLTESSLINFFDQSDPHPEVELPINIFCQLDLARVTCIIHA